MGTCAESVAGALRHACGSHEGDGDPVAQGGRRSPGGPTHIVSGDSVGIDVWAGRHWVTCQTPRP
jgi:hypothetical protein